MTGQRAAEMRQLLDGTVQDDEDQVQMVDIGLTDRVAPGLARLGIAFERLKRGRIVI